MHYDIFNGDADGIISLLQLRLANPIESVLITGIKRDIELVKQVPLDKADSLTILDISMAKNSVALEKVLDGGADVFYADHHQSGEIPKYKNLNAHIDLNADTCTALIIDHLLAGQYRLWAITAAYGDNMITKADALSGLSGLSREESEQLKELGTLINYNGYGANIEELHYHPADLYSQLKQYRSPFQAITDKNSPYHKLKQAFQQDMRQALMTDNALSGKEFTPQPSYQSHCLRLYKLKQGVASRRISGVFGNMLANESPEQAHAVLTENEDSSYTVSLRAPLNNKYGASEVCSQFVSGGGREAAAGINVLAKSEVEKLINAIEAKWGKSTS